MDNMLAALRSPDYWSAVGNTRSDPSLKQIGYGMIGIYEGLRK